VNYFFQQPLAFAQGGDRHSIVLQPIACLILTKLINTGKYTTRYKLVNLYSRF